MVRKVLKRLKSSEDTGEPPEKTVTAGSQIGGTPSQTMLELIDIQLKHPDELSPTEADALKRSRKTYRAIVGRQNREIERHSVQKKKS